jgi:hypothetical protein
VSSASKGLGRLAARDSRDDAFPLRAAIRKAPTRRNHYWPAYRVHLNQGAYPECVEFSATHLLCDSPSPWPGGLVQVRASLRSLWAETHPDGDDVAGAGALYRAAQQVDEWPGDDYEGTSVRAGMKVLQSAGLIAEYRWAASLGDIVDWLLGHGPIAIGTDWPEGWFDTDSAGRLAPLDQAGESAGGHATVLNGVNLDGARHAFGVGVAFARLKNQWRNPDGSLWGLNGHAVVRLVDIAELVLHREGEACTPTKPTAG